jgi:ABC-type lipoprotein release transport system permease subunit
MIRLPQDVRVALRGYQRTPGFALTVLAILGLGIGMSTAMFTTFDTVLIRRLPVRDQDRLVVMWPYRVRGSELAPPVGDLSDIERSSQTVSGAAGVSHWGASATPYLDGDRTVRLQTAFATTNLFDVLGVQPVRGRLFRATDYPIGSAHVVVLSYRTWQTQFDGSDATIGRKLLDPWTREAFTVVGVAPPGLDYPSGVEAWWAINQADTLYRVMTVARLRPGTSMEAARAEFFTLVNRLEPKWNLTGANASSFAAAVLGDVRPILIALMTAVGLLLLIACVNVGNLFLVRAGARARELSIRRAIGATLGDLIRQLATESALLAVGGGIIGAAIGALLLRALIVVAPVQLPRIDELSLRPSVLLVVVAVTMLATLATGIIPALIGSRVDPASPLRQDARSGRETVHRRRVRDWLIASQIALALVMLAGAGLLSRSLFELERINMGYDTDHLSIMSLAFDPKTFVPPDTTRAGRVEYNLGVDQQFEAEGQSDVDVRASPTIPWEIGGPDYFRTFGIHVLRGRGFQLSDRDGSELIAVVSESVARRLWPGQNAIGKQIRFAPSAQRDGTPLPKLWTGWRRIVGVVSDTHFREFRDASPTVYLPWRQLPGVQWANFAFRSRGDVTATSAAIRAAVKELNPTYTVWNLRTFDDVLSSPLAQPRLSALLLVAFGLVALLLATVGLYGVMSSIVREQTREIGIRVALGATPRLIRDAVLRRAMVVSAIGGLVGLVVALGGTRFLRSMLFRVSPADPITLVAVSVLLFAVTLAAAYLPARRATKVDAMIALRE